MQIPNNIELEQEIIAGFLSDETTYIDLLDIEDFYNTKHKQIFESIKISFFAISSTYLGFAGSMSSAALRR